MRFFISVRSGRVYAKKIHVIFLRHGGSLLRRVRMHSVNFLLTTTAFIRCCYTRRAKRFSFSKNTNVVVVFCSTTITNVYVYCLPFARTFTGNKGSPVLTDASKHAIRVCTPVTTANGTGKGRFGRGCVVAGNFFFSKTLQSFYGKHCRGRAG